MSPSPEHNAERPAIPPGDAANPQPRGSETPREVGGHAGEPEEAESTAATPFRAQDPGPHVGPDIGEDAGATFGDPISAFEIPRFDESRPTGVDARRVTLLSDVNLRVKIELGRTRMLVEDVLRLAEGSVVELDKLAGDPVDVYVNDRLVAHGEVLVLNDSFCVRVSEVISRDPHRVSA